MVGAGVARTEAMSPTAKALYTLRTTSRLLLMLDLQLKPNVTHGSTPKLRRVAQWPGGGVA